MASILLPHVPSAHLGGNAELCDCAIEHVEMVEEVDSCARNVAAFRQVYSSQCAITAGLLSLFTASHSSTSSPSGSTTACRRFPDPRVASAYLFS